LHGFDPRASAKIRGYNTLRHGFLEKVYENTMALEACRLGLCIQQQMRIRTDLIRGHPRKSAANTKPLIVPGI
jgi:hypothetical protein